MFSIPPLLSISIAWIASSAECLRPTDLSSLSTSDWTPILTRLTPIGIDILRVDFYGELLHRGYIQQSGRCLQGRQRQRRWRSTTEIQCGYPTRAKFSFACIELGGYRLWICCHQPSVRDGIEIAICAFGAAEREMDIDSCHDYSWGTVRPHTDRKEQKRQSAASQHCPNFTAGSKMDSTIPLSPWANSWANSPP